MKNKYIKILFFLLFLGCGNINNNNDKTVEIDRVIKLIDLKAGEDKKVVISYKNVSRKTLKLLDVVTSCGCLREENVQKKINSGETGMSQFLLTNLTKGYFEQTIFFYFENVSDPISVTIKGNVKSNQKR